jgi:hypothetical protein
MQEAGLGGVLIYPEYPQHLDDPALGIKNLRFASPEYLDVYRYAIRAARRLGMTVDAVGGSGWPYGGPSVSIDEASHAIRLATSTPEPGGKATLPALLSDEKLIGVFFAEPSGAGQPFEDATSRIQAGGQLEVGADAQNQFLAVISTPTRMQVKRPSLGGEGYVLDHLSRTAFNDYASAVLDKLVAGVRRGDLRAMFADSLEAYGSDWTGGFLDQFKQRRGYDLKPFLPYLFEERGSRTQDTRFDFWETVADLFVDEYAGPLHRWSQQHGLDVEVQAYGVPAVPQRTYQEVDLPGTEQYDWKNFSVGRWASSAAHFYGRKRVLSEYATWAGIPNRFSDTLADLKLIADLQFITGLTELGVSTLPYSPPSAGIPGWQDYSGAAFGLNQSWWPFFHNLTAYIHRASYVVEQGQPVSDVLLYLPTEDVEADAPPGSLNTAFRVKDRLAGAKEGDIPEFGLKNALSHHTLLLEAILNHGYTFDGICGDILEQRAVIRSARLAVGDGSYGVVLLPRLTGMRLGALQKIADFVRGGGTAVAVGRLPNRVYGGSQPAAETERLNFLVRQIFGANDRMGAQQEHAYGLGWGIFVEDENQLPRALLRSCPPDLSLEKIDAEIGFVHRRAQFSPNEEADYFLIANTGEIENSVQASFRIVRRQPEIWDLERGNVTHPAAYAFQGDRTIMDLHLGPRESTVVYFGTSHAKSEVIASNLPVPILDRDTVSANVSEPGTYFVKTDSESKKQTVSLIPQPIALDKSWKLEFGPPLKTSETMTVLTSWTDNPATQYFSGTGTYSNGVTLPASFLSPERVVWLDLGEVRDAARVWVNGQLAGDAWHAPFRLEITRWLHPGGNNLKIAVANLLINCVLGQKPPDYTRLEAVYGNRFPYPEEWKVNPGPWPAGLLGPVRLVPGAKIEFPLHR